MKPRNKFQKQIVVASKKLATITQAQIDWAYKNCIEHFGRRTKKGVITCLDCGGEWTDKTSTTHSTCPNCQKTIKIQDTRQRVFRQQEYFSTITAVEGFQVIRFFFIDYHAKVGQKASYYHSEVVQRWIAPNGKFATMAKLRPMGYFVNTWNYSANLEIRKDQNIHNIYPTKIYPRQKLIPEVKRSGFNKQFYDLTPFDLLSFLLSNNKAETLLKTNQIKLLQYFAYQTSKDIEHYWASIKIAIRNGYAIEDVSLWCDYIDMLAFFGKDLHNAKYVCPTNLIEEHDKYVKKKRKHHEQQRTEEARQKAFENELIFKNAKEKFFGMKFSDNLLQIKMLESVGEIMEEGDAMHHCVFTNSYYLKEDSIILSATMEGKRLETIEFSLSKLKVMQSRGVFNKQTEYHDQILDLVSKNIPQIQKRISA